MFIIIVEVTNSIKIITIIIIINQKELVDFTGELINLKEKLN